MNGSILLVDDEVAILDGLRRQLRGKFQVDVAVGAEAGLVAIGKAAYAVVVSDLRMPGMDGIRFLAEVRERSPDTVRLMLTGQADVQATIRAVNQGNLFRFLTKPCPIEEVTAALEAALAQHRLVAAERELLEKTLAGSVKVLTEILALSNPRAFGRAQRLRRTARRMAEAIRHPSAWQVELAAMLSQLGAVTVPQDLLDRADAGSELREDERKVLDGIADITVRLLANIPRLEPCARMIAMANAGTTPEGDDPVARGARVFMLIAEYERLVGTGRSQVTILTELRQKGHPMAALELLATLDATPAAGQQQAVLIRDIRPGMVLDCDARARNGVLLVAKGQELSVALIERITNYHRLMGVHEPLRVIVA